MKSFNLETHLKGIAYHCDEATTALKDVGEITQWEFLPLDESEYLQSDNESQHGQSLYRLATTIVLNVREWTSLALANLNDEGNPEELEIMSDEEDPASNFFSRMRSSFLRLIGFSEDEDEDFEDEEDDESELLTNILEAYDLLKRQLGSKETDLTGKLKEILTYIDDLEFTRGKTSTSGNSFLELKDTISKNFGLAINALLQDDLEKSLEDALQENSPDDAERARLIYERIASIETQFELWKLQEACLKWRSRLESVMGTYFGPHNSTHGNFDDLLEDILKGDRFIELESQLMYMFQRVEKMTGTIINGEDRMNIILYFGCLVNSHNELLGFKNRLPKEIVEAQL